MAQPPQRPQSPEVQPASSFSSRLASKLWGTTPPTPSTGPVAEEEDIDSKGSRRSSALSVHSSAKSQSRADARESRRNREAIVQGLALGRVLWSRNVAYDWWFYLKNSHTHIGIFLCHEMHPYKNYMRLLVWLALALGNLGLMGLFINRKEGQKVYDVEDDQTYLSIFCSVALTTVTFWMIQAYTCRCAREGGCCYCGGGGCAHERCLGCGRNVVVVGFVVCLGLLGGGWLRVSQENIPFELVGRAWLQTELYSVALGAIMHTLLFAVLWFGFPCCNFCCVCCIGNGQGGSRGWHPPYIYPHGVDYPRGEALVAFWDGDRLGCWCPAEAPEVRR